MAEKKKSTAKAKKSEPKSKKVKGTLANEFQQVLPAGRSPSPRFHGRMLMNPAPKGKGFAVSVSRFLRRLALQMQASPQVVH